ncbi:2Fe-2S iron-sulfur cluster-binding protein [Dyadobacter sp. CY312]|uniref:2Fe-2S iron-sulfur cluster-binding protein n=1 Tax=Dyadobacter sp. CY312 TaxID=2907303 RepID=UPI001F3D274F|nr:2Fe-2S iron-sulfur cluster-binding protein [Dyadobacter sp. CY312]MCE7039123.1 2Fe-2S iron-sulfur cluster-binding protein [Dyadobacter sp. CY312]
MEQEIVIKVKDPQGNLHTLDCPVDMGLSLKDICKAYELPMEAVCGGMCMCATCHCYLLSHTEALNEKSSEEKALLSELFNAKANSRLACQVPLTAELNGLCIEIVPD